MKKYLILVTLFAIGSCTGKKAAENAQEATPEKEAPPLQIPNKNEIRGVVLKQKQKTPFASDFKRNACEFGKIPIQDNDTPAIYNFAPATICTVGKKKYLTSFDEHWGHYEFADSTKIKNTKSIVAVLDYGIEGGVETVPVMRSDSGGKIWVHIGDIHKPHFSARVEHLSFTSAKVGRAMLEVNDTEKYFVDTKNGGKTWSAPYVSR